MPLKNSSRHGDHQRIHIGDFSTDRYGITAGAVEVHEVDESFDTIDLSRLYLGNAPTVSGYTIAVGCRRRWDERNAMGIYTFSYEGAYMDGYSIDSRAQCTLDGTDSQEPIETHPDFQYLFKKYKGVNDADGNFSHFQAVNIGDGDNKVFNPLFGVDHFLSMGMIWTRTYLASQLPADLLTRVDSIDTPQGSTVMRPPPLGGNRNWLQLAPTVAQRGTVLQIAQRWMASGKKGWNPDIYSQKYAMNAQNS